MGFKNMGADILEVGKLIFNLKGLALISICLFIWFLYFFIRSSNQSAYWALGISIALLILFVILSYLAWFRNDNDKNDDD